LTDAVETVRRAINTDTVWWVERGAVLNGDLLLVVTNHAKVANADGRRSRA
jgi:hypothetical protein